MKQNRDYMRQAPRTSRPGMTMIEMLIAILIFSFVMAGAMSLLRTESRSFALGIERVSMYQNGRFAINEMEKDLRAAGAGAPDVQPQLVYISDSVVVFNANYWTNNAADIEAVYYNPDAPDSAVAAMRTTGKITIPYTAIQYPDTNYIVGGINSSAETIIFYFESDTTTSRTDDYILYRRVNNLPPEEVSSNLLRTPGTPFFTYFIQRTTPAGVRSIETVPAADLPMRHSVPVHLSIADTGASAQIDSVRSIRVSFTVNNGKEDSEERLRTLTRMIRLPNVGLVNTKSCGDEPIYTDTPVITALLGPAPDSVPTIRLDFNESVDETTGERDVERYVIWKRLASVADWGEPYVILPGGGGPYQFTDAMVVRYESYVYAVAAQDCTPSMSPRRASNSVTIP